MSDGLPETNWKVCIDHVLIEMSRLCCQAIGSLSNDENDDGNENATKQWD